jgi:hypothetical protein
LVDRQRVQKAKPGASANRAGVQTVAGADLVKAPAGSVGGPSVALLSAQRRCPVLTAVAGCHLRREKRLPDPADAGRAVATTEVPAIDAAGKSGRHVCQLSRRPG